MLELTLPFPSLAFGIGFAVLLLGILSVASWVDIKEQRIPKKLTVGLFLAGLIISLVRGGWLGAKGESAWVLHWNTLIGGSFEGLLFSMSGAALGFVVFFPLWMTRAVLGGGDVKLVTAAGAWLGPWGLCLAALISMMAFTVIGIGRILVELSYGVMPSLAPRERDIKNRKARRRISYSLSFSIGVALVVLFALQGPLGLIPSPKT